jgi:hypothetical protein
MMKNFQWKSLLPHAIAVAVFLMVAIIFCKPALNGKVLQQNDVIHWKGMAQDLVNYKEKHGHYPLWNNNLFSGMPAYQVILVSDNPVSIGYWHILFTLFLLKPIGFFFLLCISFYFLSQVLKVNPYIGIMGSLAYAYASFSSIIIVAGHDTQMLALGYVPALLAALLLLYHKKYWWGAALTALFSGLLIQQNHLQITYYFLIIAVFMTISYLVQWIRAKEFKHAVIAIVIALVTGGLGAACNLVNLATTNDYSKATMRNGTLNLDTAKNATGTRTQSGLPIDYAFGWSYGKAETFTLLVPGIYGGGSNGELHASSNSGKFLAEKGVSDDQVENFTSGLPTYWGAQPFTSGPVYLGAIICFLFIAGMFYLKTPDKWWILAICILAIFMSWGKNFAFFNDFLFNYLPLYNKFRVPTMTLVIPQLLFPVIAMLTLQQFFFEETDKEEALKQFKKGALVTGGFFLIAVLLYFSFNYVGANDDGFKAQLTKAFGTEDAARSFYKVLLQDRQNLFGYDLFRSFIFVVLAAGVLWLFIKNKIKYIYALGTIAILSTVDIIAVSNRYLNENSFQDSDSIDDSYFKPSQADALILKDSSYYRVMNLSADVFNDAITSYHHHSIGGYHPAKLSIYEDLLNFQLRKQPMNFRVLDMLNAKYIIVGNPQTNQPQVQQNPEALGACWFVKAVQFEKDPAQVMKALNTFNPKDTAIVEEKFKSDINISAQFDSASVVKLVNNDNDFIEYHSNSGQNQFAVFSEIFYDRGWKAYIDDKESPIIQTNYALRGLSVPAGNHKITFEFKPASFYSSNKIAITASALIWLLIVAALVQTFRKRREDKA